MVAILTAAHHGFELTSGVGLVWQPELGLAPASALWGAQIPLWVTLAARGSRRWDRLLAVLSGTALAGVFVHFLLWPWHRNRLGIPILTEAEGLEPKVLPAYNTLLHAWAVASALSILHEVRPGARRWSLVGLAALPLLRRSAQHHFSWLTQEAQKNPAWWNRGVLNDGRVDIRPRPTRPGLSRGVPPELAAWTVRRLSTLPYLEVDIRVLVSHSGGVLIETDPLERSTQK